MSIAITDLIAGALTEIRVKRAGDVVEPEVQADALQVLNDLLDELNTDTGGLYADQFFTAPIIPNHQPHLIGAAAYTPDWTVATGRPTALKGANIILTNNIRKPLDLLDAARWMRETAFAIVSAIPQGCYYDPTYPTGSVYLWPIPTVAYTFEAWLKVLLVSVAATDTFDLPAGYQRLLTLMLAVEIAEHHGQTVTRGTLRKLERAWGAVAASTNHPPRIRTRDGGMPGARGNLFDYRTGRVGQRF